MDLERFVVHVCKHDDDVDSHEEKCQNGVAPRGKARKLWYQSPPHEPFDANSLANHYHLPGFSFFLPFMEEQTGTHLETE